MMDVMVAKVPTPKMKMSAIFSRRGLLILIRALMGRAMIQISVMMLKPEVTIGIVTRISKTHGSYTCSAAETQVL